MIVNASCNFLTVNTRTSDRKDFFLDSAMMKNKSKKQEDEGSTRSNASRYDPFIIFFFTFPCLSGLFTSSSVVAHLSVHFRLVANEVFHVS